MTDHDLMGRSVATLVADPDRPADVRVTLTVRKERFRLASGEQVDGYTVNGTSPGPVIHAVQGQLVEVRLRQRVGAGRRDPALARRRRPQRRGRGRRRHPGRRAGRRARSPTGSSPTRSGRTGTTRTRSRTRRCRAGCSGRWWSRRRRRPSPDGPLRPARGAARLRRRRRRSTAPPATCRWTRRTARRCGCASSTPTTVRPRSGRPASPYRVLAVDGYDLHGPTPVSRPRGAAHRRRPGRPRGRPHRPGSSSAGRARSCSGPARRPQRRSRPGWSTC